VADDGFDFHTPDRREAKRFEPPPWEREAFEDLERKRVEQQEAEQAAAPQAPPAEPEAAPEAQQSEAEKPEAAAQGLGPEEGGATSEPQLDEGKVAEMLAGLSAEEPREYRSLWRIAIASAIVLGAIGAVLIIWAMAAIVGARETGAVGLTGGFVLLFFGAGFVAGAWWLTVRTLRQRGVL